jgi:multimeric flavodoxin WrbA
MKVIGFAASPRKAGNTYWIVDKILEGARERNAETGIWNSSDLDIKPCRGCMGCLRDDRRCHINDDMQAIYGALEDADALVLGTPVYMGQMSAQAKIFTDRLFAWITPRFSPHFREKNAGKKLVLSFNQGNPDADKFKAYFEYTKSMFQMLEFDVREVHVVAGTRNAPAHEISGLPAVLKNIGASLVSWQFRGQMRARRHMQ